MNTFAQSVIHFCSQLNNRQTAVLLVGSLLCFNMVNAQWSKVTAIDSLGGSQIVFVDSLRGYIATYGMVLATTDGGTNWNQKKVEPHSLLSVSAVGKNDVWASSAGMVFFSHNGGDTWDSVSVADTSYDFNTLQFVDSLHGWILGSIQFFAGEGQQAIFHSIDGGRTWKEQYWVSTPYFPYLKKGFFLDSLHGWAAQQYAVLKTSDGGETWGGAFVTGDYMQSVFFIDSLKGWSIGVEMIAKTYDGGLTWTTVFHQQPYVGEYSSVFFADSSNGWVCDDAGGIIQTSDGGYTWNTQRPSAMGSYSLSSIFFTNKNNGWAVGGNILHTTNGGVTSVHPVNGTPSTFALSQNFPNPFNPTTAIHYQLAVGSFVTLKVYDILGREAVTLVNAQESSGTHSVIWNASSFPSGAYFYRLRTVSTNGQLEDTKQMMLVK